jgi:hypothetical protein
VPCSIIEHDNIRINSGVSPFLIATVCDSGICAIGTKTGTEPGVKPGLKLNRFALPTVWKLNRIPITAPSADEVLTGGYQLAGISQQRFRSCAEVLCILL